ncbi:MAG: alpha/beta fold hydrolase, partial [Micromonosporaceae bacterium]
MNERTIDVGGGISLAYQEIGDPEAAPMLLVAGLGQQLHSWPDGFCEQLAARGYRLIRFDNRDVGRSTHLRFRPPSISAAMMRRWPPEQYDLGDMAADTVGLLDALDCPEAHLVGVSMGGMIGQTMAITRPERLLSLTSIMSTTGERRAGMPKLRVWSLLMRRAPHDREAFQDYFVRMFRIIGSPGFRQDEARVRELAAATFDRAHHPAGTARQLAAILASGDRTQ